MHLTRPTSTASSRRRSRRTHMSKGRCSHRQCSSSLQAGPTIVPLLVWETLVGVSKTPHLAVLGEQVRTAGMMNDAWTNASGKGVEGGVHEYLRWRVHHNASECSRGAHTLPLWMLDRGSFFVPPIMLPSSSSTRRARSQRR